MTLQSFIFSLNRGLLTDSPVFYFFDTQVVYPIFEKILHSYGKSLLYLKPIINPSVFESVSIPF